MSTYRWGGYEFSVHDYDTTTDWPDDSGLYVFAKRGSIGLLGQGNPEDWEPLYVGKAVSFKTRPLANHPMWPAAVKLGATHIHTLVEQGPIKRTLVEALLIQELKPPLNTQLK